MRRLPTAILVALALAPGPAARPAAAAGTSGASRARLHPRPLPGTPAAALGVCDIPVWTADGDQAGARFGTIAPAGDVNRDGYDDVIIGAYNDSHPETNEGRVFLYLGGPAGLAATPAWTAESNQAGASMGDKLSGAGDVNGDGYADLVVGAAFYDHTATDEGAAFLYLGGPSGPAATPAWVTYGGQASANYGACAQGAGDVNGDGYDDVIIGQWLYSGPGLPFEGRAYLYLGGPNGPSTTPAWIGENGAANSVYGYFCTRAGDVNGDGYGDIVVGARRFNGDGLTKEGCVYVYYGGPGGPATTPDWVHHGDQAGGEFGESVACAGDVNGDGYDDLIVSAFRYDTAAGADAGRAYLFLGGPQGLAQTPSWVVDGDQDSAYFAYHVDGAGDINGDGYDDVVLSASQYDVNGFRDAGRAYVYLGGPNGLAATPAWIQDGDQEGGGLGNAVRGVGDVNGDGYADIGTGALYHDNGGATDEGRAYVFYGCPNGVTGVSPDGARGPSLALAGANPFRSGVSLAVALPRSGAVRLSILDPAGREIARLADGALGPGRHVLTWDGAERQRPAAAGLYLARLATPWGSRALKLVRVP